MLTYLPDLQWCHVAPLERRGTFGSKPSPSGHVAEGRERWMLVSEDEGGEIDVGAGRCHIMEAVEMLATKANADTEEWDVLRRASPEWIAAQVAEPSSTSNMHPMHVCTCASSCVWHVYTGAPLRAEHAPRACMHVCILMCMACTHRCS